MSLFETRRHKTFAFLQAPKWLIYTRVWNELNYYAAKSLLGSFSVKVHIGYVFFMSPSINGGKGIIMLFENSKIVKGKLEPSLLLLSFRGATFQEDLDCTLNLKMVEEDVREFELKIHWYEVISLNRALSSVWYSLNRIDKKFC